MQGAIGATSVAISFVSKFVAAYFTKEWVPSDGGVELSRPDAALSQVCISCLSGIANHAMKIRAAGTQYMQNIQELSFTPLARPACLKVSHSLDCFRGRLQRLEAVRV